LYSDILPEFYEAFGFVRLKSEGQRYKPTICMVKGRKITKLLADKESSPEYF
jgi:hypothetical protein